MHFPSAALTLLTRSPSHAPRRSPPCASSDRSCDKLSLRRSDTAHSLTDACPSALTTVCFFGQELK